MKIGVPSAGPNAMTSDMALVTAIRSGDQGAMKALYDRYSSIVYSVALRVLQDTGALRCRRLSRPRTLRLR
jgi:RNA polymerase sigma-70 factor, ECF subfamily